MKVILARKYQKNSSAIVLENTMSDSLLRKKQHRRSLSNTLPQKLPTIHSSASSSVHVTTTPPPGPAYTDDNNIESGNRLFKNKQ